MSPAPPAGAGWIALSGLVPLVLLASALPLAPAPWRGVITDGLISYGAVVAGFLAGARWGAELVRVPGAPSLGRLAAAGLMTMAPFGALMAMAQPALAFGLLLAAGLGQLFWDLAGARSGLLPAWTFRLRIGLTLIGGACLAIGLLYGM